MNKKIFVGIVIACLIICVVPLVSQAVSQKTQKTITVVDAMGNKVELPYPVERIACFTPQASEIIVALGEEDKIVGIDSFTKWCPEFYPTLKDKPLIGMVPVSPNYEKIIDLKPDVVLAYTDPLFNYPNLEETMSSAGIKVVRLDLYKPETFSREVNILGKMLGEEKEAKEYIDFAEAYAKKIEEKVKDIPPEERVRVYYEWFMPYIAYGKNTGPYQLIEMAGGVDIVGSEGGQALRMPGYSPEQAPGAPSYPMMSPEWMVGQDPQVIIKDYLPIAGMMPAGKKVNGYTSKPDTSGMRGARDKIMNRPGFKGIDAVKNGKVYVTPFGDFMLSPRWPVALGYMAKWSYPDRFEDLDPQAFHAEWLKKWYGLEYKGVYVYP